MPRNEQVYVYYSFFLKFIENMLHYFIIMKNFAKKIVLILLFVNFILPARSAEFFTIGAGSVKDINFELSNAICKMVAKLLL